MAFMIILTAIIPDIPEFPTFDITNSETIEAIFNGGQMILKILFIAGAAAAAVWLICHLITFLVNLNSSVEDINERQRQDHEGIHDCNRKIGDLENKIVDLKAQIKDLETKYDSLPEQAADTEKTISATIEELTS